MTEFERLLQDIRDKKVNTITIRIFNMYHDGMTYQKYLIF